jgi:hypothetical protein
MRTLEAKQKGVLELMLSAAKAQAEVVQHLMRAEGDAKLRALGSEIGGLLVKAVERSPEIIDSLAAGLTQFLSSAGEPISRPRTGNAGSARRPVSPEVSSTPAGVPAEGPQKSQPVGGSNSTPPQPAPEPQPLTESQQLDAIVRVIAEGFSACEPGSAVADRVRARYPAAIPTMQQYLGMDDFLVIMWLRQQPAIAAIASDPRFPQFYAEFKEAMMRYGP